MVVQELRVRYQRSMLGFFWTLLNPILMMATMTFFFSQVFDFAKGNYPVYLFAGMVPWNFLSTSLNDCAMSIIQSEDLIRKIYLPKLIFPLTRLLINLTTFVLSMAALFLLLEPLGARLSVPMLAACRWSSLLFALFTLGLGLIVATANTFYRDCGHLVAVFLQAWYFATPIFYKTSMLNGAAVAVLAEPGLSVHQAVPGRSSSTGVGLHLHPVLGGRRHRDGEPGGRLCRIQVP